MPGAFDRGNYSRTSSTGLLREPSICSDALTRDIFSNIEETLNKGTKHLLNLKLPFSVRELCKTCYQYNTLHLDDAQKLFDSAKFELVFVYIYFENRTHVNDLGAKSSPMIRGLIESLEKCEISVSFSPLTKTPIATKYSPWSK